VFNFGCKVCDSTDKTIETTDYQTIVQCNQCGYVTTFDNEDLEQVPHICSTCGSATESETVSDDMYIEICHSCGKTESFAMDVQSINE